MRASRASFLLLSCAGTSIIDRSKEARTPSAVQLTNSKTSSRHRSSEPRGAPRGAGEIPASRTIQASGERFQGTRKKKKTHTGNGNRRPGVRPYHESLKSGVDVSGRHGTQWFRRCSAGPFRSNRGFPELQARRRGVRSRGRLRTTAAVPGARPARQGNHFACCWFLFPALRRRWQEPSAVYTSGAREAAHWPKTLPEMHYAALAPRIDGAKRAQQLVRTQNRLTERGRFERGVAGIWVRWRCARLGLPWC